MIKSSWDNKDNRWWWTLVDYDEEKGKEGRKDFFIEYWTKDKEIKS